MNVQTIVSASAALAHLGIAALAFVHIRHMHLGRVFIAMAFAFSVWIASDVLSDYIWHGFFETIDETAVCFSAACGVDFILSFIGMREARRRWVLASYAWFFALAGLTALGLVHPPLRDFSSSQTWSALMLTGLAIFLSHSFYLAVRYAIDAASNDERQRTRTVLLGILISMTLGPTDALRTLSPALQSELPRMSDLGSLFIVALLYVSVSRAKVAGVELATNRAFQALSLMLVVLLAVIVSFFALRDDIATWFAVSATATAILVLVTYHWVQLNTEEKARTQNFATMGRLSAQLAHDLRNPISAIKAATEFIEGERDAERILLTQEVARYIELIHDQADRMNTLVERYRLFSDQDVRRSSVDVRGLIERCLEGLKGVIPTSIAVKRQVDARLSRFMLDPDLIAAAFDNLVRNAVEAMPEGGSLVVSATQRQDGGLALEVADNGQGMSPGEAERVFQEFYTTKAKGSGLGLAFVRRIVENHRGRVELTSAPGEGTRVTLILPSGE